MLCPVRLMWRSSSSRIDSQMAKPYGPDDHAAPHRRVAGQLGLQDQVVVPAGEVLGLTGQVADETGVGHMASWWLSDRAGGPASCGGTASGCRRRRWNPSARRRARLPRCDAWYSLWRATRWLRAPTPEQVPTVPLVPDCAVQACRSASTRSERPWRAWNRRESVVPRLAVRCRREPAARLPPLRRGSLPAATATPTGDPGWPPLRSDAPRSPRGCR